MGELHRQSIDILFTAVDLLTHSNIRVIDHLQNCRLVEILAIETIGTIARQITNSPLRLLVIKVQIRTLVGELVGTRITFFTYAHVGDIGAERPSHFVLGSPKIDRGLAVLFDDTKGPTTKGAAVVVLAQSLAGLDADVLSISGLDVGAAAR